MGLRFCWFRPACLAVALCLGLCAGSPARAAKVVSNGFSYFVDKAPAWAAAPNPREPVLTEAARKGPFELLLIDTQVNLLQAKPQTFTRARLVAWERGALEPLSNINLDFNPSYQTLTLHELSVVRGGKREDRLKKSRISLAQRETQLEQAVYDETVTAIISVDDVRVGDVLEYAYTVSGDSPVYNGKFFGYFGLNAIADTTHLSVRVDYPANRKLAWKVHRSELAPTETQQGNVKTLRLTADQLRGVREEPATARWFKVYPWLQVTEYASWAEVENWAAGFYTLPRSVGPKVEAAVERIRAGAKTPEEKAAQALAFVQDEIRYYSLAVGLSTHKPRPPEQTLEQRFGDCKDKTMLLAAMLDRLGIEAKPALVSMGRLRGVADWLPTPQAFDHIIVQAKLSGQTYWLDATATYQGRNLREASTEPFGRALVVGAGAGDLTAVAQPRAGGPDIDSTETYAIKDYGGPVELTAVTRYRGSRADYARRAFASRNTESLGKGLLTEYQRLFPRIEALGAPEIKDDRDTDVLVLTEQYRIADFFEYQRGTVRLSVAPAPILGAINLPRETTRETPLELLYPSTMRHRIELRWPAPLPYRPGAPVNVRAPQFELGVRADMKEATTSVDYEYRVLSDQVLPADFADYRENLRKARLSTVYSLAAPTFPQAGFVPRIKRDLQAAGLDLSKEGDGQDQMLARIISRNAVADEAINGGHLAGKVLAAALLDRATTASQLGRRDDALTDIERAIALDPTAGYHVLRGEIRTYTGRGEQALADYDQAVKIDPNYEGTYKSRGIQLYFLGRYDEARKDLQRAADAASRDDFYYSAMWLYYATQRGGGDAKAALRPYRERATADRWPAAALAYLMGEGSEKDMFSQARAKREDERLNLCEAYFVAGQRALLAGETERAREWFEKAVATNARFYLEYTFANQELARIKGGASAGGAAAVR